MPDDRPRAPRRSTDLHALAQAVRKGQDLGPEARQALADFLDSLDEVREADASSPEARQVREKAAHLLQAVQHKHAPGVLAAARDGLEQAVLRAEAAAPVTAGAFRRLLDALAAMGI
jgi:hypothetical protein